MRVDRVRVPRANQRDFVLNRVEKVEDELQREERASSIAVTKSRPAALARNLSQFTARSATPIAAKMPATVPMPCTHAAVSALNWPFA